MRLTDEVRGAIWHAIAPDEREYLTAGEVERTQGSAAAVERVLLCGKAVNVKYDSAGNPSYELRIPIIRGN